jgi:hypothetical protein
LLPDSQRTSLQVALATQLQYIAKDGQILIVAFVLIYENDIYIILRTYTEQYKRNNLTYFTELVQEISQLKERN